MARRQVSSKYKGTVLGFFWSLLTPLLMFAVYGTVFIFVFEMRWPGEGNSKEAYLLAMLCGLTFYNIFSESLTAALDSVRGNPNFVKKVVFPMGILPASSVITAFYSGLFWFFLLGVALLAVNGSIHSTAWILPVFILPLFLLSMGCAWIVASLKVYFKDTSQFIEILLRVLLYASPIFYSVKMLPENFQRILLLNPLATMIEGARQILLQGEVPDMQAVLILYAISILVFHAGFVWFEATKKGFADVL